MKKKSRRAFPIIAIVCAVCFGSVGTVFAVDPSISITLPDVIDIGSIPNPGNYEFFPTLFMEVVASRGYDIVLTMPTTLLTHTNTTSTINIDNFQVLNPLSLRFELGSWVRAVNLKFTVNSSLSNRAGEYSGELVFTAIPDP